MKSKVFGASLMLAVFCSAAIAKPPTPQHSHQYTHLYYEVQHKFGHRAPGREILKWGFTPHRRATDDEVIRSIGVLERMLAPPPPVAVFSTTTYTSTPAVQTSTVPVSSAPSSGLASCIISHESGGNAQAVSPNGKYKGIGQWQQSTWLSDGGGRYSPTPLGASYSQQLSVLQGEGTAGMRSQQAQYDGC